MTNHTRDRLSHILAAITNIREAESQLNNAELAGNVQLANIAHDAILFNLVVIGEAANALPEAITAQAPEIPWRNIVGMRNFLTHEYFRITTDVIRSTIGLPLKELESACHMLANQ